MGTGHSHTGPAGHIGGRYRRKLAIAFGLIATFFVVELVYGLIADSLALISDAGHMAADVVALGAALTATKIATRPDATGRNTAGWGYIQLRHTQRWPHLRARDGVIHLVLTGLVHA